jgi:hypothetical protein
MDSEKQPTHIRIGRANHYTFTCNVTCLDDSSDCNQPTILHKATRPYATTIKVDRLVETAKTDE